MHPRAARLVLWLTGSIAVVIAAGVAASLMITGVPGPAETGPEVLGGSEPAIMEEIPTPELVSATAHGATVIFTGANPDAREGDSMIWRRTDLGDSEPPRQVNDGKLAVEGFDGAIVCIEVHVIRSGRESANPLETCYPS
ncbi:MAG TPA: hypothetical protein VFT01_10745 [Homoserinimonas sp.]|nr:hypothetical protein [Homoserinimonas sp.]